MKTMYHIKKCNFDGEKESVTLLPQKMNGYDFFQSIYIILFNYYEIIYYI